MKRRYYEIEKDANHNRYYVTTEYRGKTYQYYRYTRSVWAAIAQIKRFKWYEDNVGSVNPHERGWDIIKNY